MTRLEAVLAVLAAALVAGLLILAAVHVVGPHDGSRATDADTLILRPDPPPPETVLVAREISPRVVARPDLSEHFGAFVVEDSTRGLLSCFDHDVWYPE